MKANGASPSPGRVVLEDRTSGYALSLFRPVEEKAIEVLDQKGKSYLTCAATGNEGRSKWDPAVSAEGSSEGKGGRWSATRT